MNNQGQENDIFRANNHLDWLEQTPAEFISAANHEILRAALAIKGWTKILQAEPQIVSMTLFQTDTQKITMGQLLHWLSNCAEAIQEITDLSSRYAYKNFSK